MKALSYLFSFMLLVSMLFSCGESSRDQIHEEVVEEEREEDDIVVGTDPVPTERELEITARDTDFIPESFTVEAGQDLSVALLNQSDMEHNVVFELPSGEKTLPQNVPAAQSDILEFEAPQEPGTYVYYCPIDDHRDKGMEGKLIVVEAGAQP